jgi:signal transduction histidine kinase
MPTGGEVTVRVAADRVTSEARGLIPGLYARISVADTGVGMQPSVLERASEPFFTTKPAGKGTGLGLTGARAFAERAGGALHIESEQGRGTVVTLWLHADAHLNVV